MAKKATKVEEPVAAGAPELSTKEKLVNVLKAKAAGLFDREPQPGMSDAKLNALAEEILNLL